MVRSFILLCLVVVASGGCATGGARPHTAEESFWLIQAGTASALDAALTSAGVGSGKLVEMNGFYADNKMEHNGGIFPSKIVFLGVAYTVGYFKPDWRLPLYKGIAALNYTVSGWNAYQIVEH